MRTPLSSLVLITASLAASTVACTSQRPALAPDASGDTTTSVTTTAPAPATSVAVGPYVLATVDPASVGVAEAIVQPDFAGSPTLLHVTRDGQSVALVFRWRVGSAIASDPATVERFVQAAAAGAPLERIEVAGAPADLYSVPSPQGVSTVQVVQATPAGDLVLALGAERGALIDALDVAIPASTEDTP